jgi:hypothetical protein
MDIMYIYTYKYTGTNISFKVYTLYISNKKVPEGIRNSAVAYKRNMLDAASVLGPIGIYLCIRVYIASFFNS